MTNQPARTSIFRLFVDATFTLAVIGGAAYFGLKQWNPELLAALPGMSVPVPEITDERLEALAEQPLIPDSAIQNPDQLPESPVAAETPSESEHPEFAQPRFQTQYRQVRPQSPCQQSRQPVYRVVYYRSGGCR